MSKPLIGVCSRWNRDSSQYALHPRDCDMVRANGASAVILPFDFEEYELLDGIIFTGGGDVDSSIGGYADCDLVHYDAPARDEAEVRHCTHAVQLGLPILAICRGCQLVNAVLGGNLVRDLAEAGYGAHNAQCLVGTDGIAHHAHRLDVVEGTLLQSLLGKDPLVLSLHHQAVKTPAPGLRINAYSPDGVIEGYEDPARKILGLQTHPEMMDCNPPYIWLVEQASRYHEEKRKG